MHLDLLLLLADQQRRVRDVDARIKRYQDKQVSFNYFEKSVSWETYKNIFWDGFANDGFLTWITSAHKKQQH